MSFVLLFNVLNAYYVPAIYKVYRESYKRQAWFLPCWCSLVWDPIDALLVCICSHVLFFATPWTITYQSPLSMGFSKKEYCSGLPFPSPGDIPDPRMEPTSPVSPALPAAAANSLQLCPTLQPQRQKPTRLPCPWDSPDKNTRVGAISFSNAWKWKVKVKSLSHVRLFVTPWTAAYQAPLSMGFSRQRVLEWVASKLICIYRGSQTNLLSKCLPKYHFRDKKEGFRGDSLWITILPSILCSTDIWEFGILGVFKFKRNAKAWLMQSKKNGINSKCLCSFL